MGKIVSIQKNPFFAICIRFFGKRICFCLCHHLPERSIKFFGIEKYLCARCFGVLSGTILGLLFLFFYPLNLIWSLFFIMPLCVDGFLQLVTQYSSTNPRRFITGFLYGIGFLSLLYHIIMFGVRLFIQ